MTEKSSGTKTVEEGVKGWRHVHSVWWPRIRSAGKGITGLSGLGAAIVAIAAWYPMANDHLHPELKEYENLKALYVGASVSLFDSKLGAPSIVKAVPGEPEMTERMYVKPDYVVETVATREGQTKLFSVLSCNPDFRPSFEFLGSRVTLQDKPLADQKPFGRPPSELFYEVPQTVSSPEFYFELTADTSGASHNRGSGYGVNGACSKDLPSVDYAGPVADAPQEINVFRERVPANFYVESLDRSLSNSSNPSLGPFLLVTPYFEDLPPGWPSRS